MAKLPIPATESETRDPFLTSPNNPAIPRARKIKEAMPNGLAAAALIWLINAFPGG
jgi:hypothetical protein